MYYRYRSNTRTQKKCENCGSPVPSNRRDTFCSDMCTDDGYDMARDMGYDRYNARDWRWGSWDK